jgi:hypothetical protein
METATNRPKRPRGTYLVENGIWTKLDVPNRRDSFPLWLLETIRAMEALDKKKSALQTTVVE